MKKRVGSMRVSGDAFSMIQEELNTMQNFLIDSLQNQVSITKALHEVNGVIFKIRQILANEFYIIDYDGDDTPPAA